MADRLWLIDMVVRHLGVRHLGVRHLGVRHLGVRHLGVRQLGVTHFPGRLWANRHLAFIHLVLDNWSVYIWPKTFGY